MIDARWSEAWPLEKYAGRMGWYHKICSSPGIKSLFGVEVDENLGTVSIQLIMDSIIREFEIIKSGGPP